MPPSRCSQGPTRGRRHRPAERGAAAGRRAEHRAGAQHRAVSRHRAAARAGPGEVDRGRPGSGAQSAADRCAAAARGRGRRSAPDDLYEVGSVAGILRYVTAPGRHPPRGVPGPAALSGARVPARLSVHGGACRALRGARRERRRSRRALLHLKERALEALQLLPQVPPELINAVQSASSASQGADLVRASWT